MSKSVCLNTSADAACSGGFTTSTEVILLSPGGTSSNYQNNLNCVWTIKVASWYKVCVLISSVWHDELFDMLLVSIINYSVSRSPFFNASLDRYPYGERPPWTETPRTETPRRNMGPRSQIGSDIIQRPPPPRGQTNASENNTLPQTSFEGGNKSLICYHPFVTGSDFYCSVLWNWALN